MPLTAPRHARLALKDAIEAWTDEAIEEMGLLMRSPDRHNMKRLEAK